MGPAALKGGIRYVAPQSPMQPGVVTCRSSKPAACGGRIAVIRLFKLATKLARVLPHVATMSP